MKQSIRCLCCVVLLGTATISLTRAQVTEADSLALVALYNATDGPNWSSSANWLTGPVPTWHGIGEIFAGTVRSLDLRGNNLTGVLPNPLGLGGLQSLSLSDNQLSGALPADLSNRQQLSNLILSNNQFTGSIPGDLGSVNQLDDLRLDNNQFSGEIPAALGGRRGLERLQLNDNPSLGGSIPLSFVDLTNLATFHFQNTGLCEPSDAAFQDWIQGINDVMSTGVTCTPTATEEDDGIPTVFVLHQNYPNPFNPATRIRFSLSQPQHVTLTVYDVYGREVATLLDGFRQTGPHEATFDARGLASGLYVYRLQADRFAETRVMTLLK